MKFGIVALLLVVTQASATSFAPPAPYRVTSQNGAFSVLVNPDSELHEVYSASQPGTPAWSFTKRVQFESFLVANDGLAVAILPWTYVQVRQMQAGVGIELWNAHGMLAKLPISELCPRPRHTNDDGPIGEFWRTWKTSVDDRGTSFRVHTTCGSAPEILYSDGTTVGQQPK